MGITVIGSGYVGAVTAAGFSQLGHNVVCVDVDEARVRSINGGKAPIYEPGLDGALALAVREKKLRATSDLAGALKTSGVAFICVGTPPMADGSTDLRFVREVAQGIADALRQRDSYLLIVVKSTVPPGTTESLIPLLEEKSGKRHGKDFGIAMNPEFLREGRALEDFLRPDRIVLGTADAKGLGLLQELYAQFQCPKVACNLRTAEMVKYASNAFLATKISFINEIANLCDRLGIDAYAVAEGMGHDRRIGRAFLDAGIGYGGSCFPKDVKSLVATAKREGSGMRILPAVVETNESQPLRIVGLAEKCLGGLEGRRIAVLGLAFKPDSDDVREAPALKIIAALLKKGAKVVAYDPKAMENARARLGDGVAYASSARGALEGAEACLLLTEWEEFKNLQGKDFNAMKRKLAIEGRRCLDRGRLEGVEYHGIGRGI
jgi:UDPglucose 6-dehydrogenase